MDSVKKDIAALYKAIFRLSEGDEPNYTEVFGILDKYGLEVDVDLCLIDDEE